MPLKSIHYHSEALVEYENQIAYHLDKDDVTKADQFILEIQTAIQKIAAHLLRWKKVFEVFHSFGPTKKFKYRIGYWVQPDAIFVVAIYYSGASDPLYWIDRDLD